MCDPVTATVVVGAVGLGLNVAGDIAEHKAQNKAAEENRKLALQSLKLQDHELSIEEVQTRLAGAQQKAQAGDEVTAAQGDITASAASRGVGGASIDLLLQDATAQGARFNASVDRNTAAQAGEVSRQKDAALEEAKARIAGVPKASNLATGLKIGSHLVDAASLYIGRRNRAKEPK